VRPNGSDVVIRRERFRKGILETGWLDTDEDGTFDLKRSYNPMGREIAETKLDGEVQNR
jgi:hypothetical protein